jgi:hypothetical protein
LNHSYTVLQLVGVKLIPLISSERALETRSPSVVVTDLRYNDNAPEISSSRT